MVHIKSTLPVTSRCSPKSYGQLRDAALGCGPVHDIEPRHARELALVGGHEGCAMSARLRGDQQVVMADRRAGALGIGELERQWFHIQCEQGAQRRLVARPLCALLVAVDQFEQRNGRDTDALATRELLCEPAARAARAVVEHRDDGVRVKALHASKKTRLSGTTGGSSAGRTSGKGSPVKSRSISAKTAATSAGLRAIGSKITRLPTRVTRTSFPGKRNSLGSRTAWLGRG